MPSLRPLHAAGALLLLVVAGCAQAPVSGAEDSRYLVYFNEFSANLSDDAQAVVATAAARIKEVRAKAIRVEGRASATGSAAANQALTETRTQIVYDELRKDGVDPAMIQQQALGQVTTTDTSVRDRRVDIVVLK